MGEGAISEEFVKRHYAGLFALLHRRIKDPALAQDILNEAMATAMAHVQDGRVSQPDRLAGYVFRVAMNLYRNHRREFDNRSDLRAPPDELQNVPSQTFVGDGLGRDVLRQVRALISSLPTPRDREIVKRFYLDEEDKEHICSSLGLTPLHFDKVVFRARQRMRTLLEQSGFHRSDFFNVLLACCA